jgi:Phasin protein
MAKPTETRAPVRPAKSPTARRGAAPNGNGRAPRSPAEARRTPRPPSESANEIKARDAGARSAPEREPTQAPSTSPPSAAQAVASAAPEPHPLPSEPGASEQAPADRPTGAASEIPPRRPTAPPESASAPADRPATPRPDQPEAEPAAGPPLAWLEGPARLREEMAGFARAQLEDALATGQAILTCGSLPRALELQASYAVRAMQGNLAQAMRLARLSAELMPAALTPRKPF